MNIILATRNPSKALQVQELFAGSQLTIQTLEQANIVGEAVEDGLTLEENALKKARFAHEEAPGSWTMADDTGIFINALNGEPGIRSARWAGDVSTDEITAYCLKRLEGTVDRAAIFKTVVALINPEGEEQVFTGEVSGTLLEAPRVPAHPKMPYSPLFVPDGETQCWAEMTTEHENEISHRGKAFAQVRSFLETLA